jgi:hypothetical protein
MARVQVVNQTTLNENPEADQWTMWFQWCRYFYDDGTMQEGYRFIWKRPQNQGGALQAARGQARIQSISMIEQLIAKAKKDGWGDHVVD